MLAKEATNASENPLTWKETYAQIWQLLDAQMHADFDQIQMVSDSECEWLPWDDDSREQWSLWIFDQDNLEFIEIWCFSFWLKIWQQRRARK